MKIKRIKTSSIVCVSLFLLFVVGSAHSVVAQTNDNSNQAKQPLQNRRLTIKKKPAAPIGDCDQSDGTTRVRVTLDKSGKVTAVALVIESGCYSFDKNVVSAAKKIKFEPEIKDGEPITVTKLFEYKFTKF